MKKCSENKIEKRLVKVLPFQVVKSTNMSWLDFSKALRDVRYRLWRLANIAISERYVQFQQWYNADKQEVLPSDSNERHKLKTINRILRNKLVKEKHATEEELSKYSRDGAVSGYVYGAFDKMYLSALTSKSKWREVITGNTSLPVFKRDMAIPMPSDTKIEKTESGGYEVDLPICMKAYRPRILLSTAKLSAGQKAVLERLVENTEDSLDGYRSRMFSLKEKKGKWWFSVSYDFPKSMDLQLDSNIIIGVDLGWSVPLYAAVSNSKARIGYEQLKPLGDNIKRLQRQVVARRRSMQNAGKQDLVSFTARSGHGRKRSLLPTEDLQGKIDDAYKTLNHQLSHCVVQFAKDHGAGIIQIEDLASLKEKLRGTFLGRSWRLAELQSFILYKAEVAGIIVKEVDAHYTSQRCSECGYINRGFTFNYRQANKQGKNSTMFECPECGYKENADHNAARNLATEDIAEKICIQLEKQSIINKEDIGISLTI